MSAHGPILLIDDDEDEWELIGEALHQVNIVNKLECFSNGREALQYLKNTSENPFIIFCDINMPDMGGLELRKIIYDDEELRKKSIPFIFLTTMAGTPAVRTAYEFYVQGFFEKAINLQELKKQLNDICEYWKKCKHPNNFNI